MRSRDLENWSGPELLKVKGNDVPRKKMGRMIDPYLLEDAEEEGKWWCFYKQRGVSMSYSYDLKSWTYVGNAQAGENATVIDLTDEVTVGKYIMFFHGSSKEGMRAQRAHGAASLAISWSDDLVNWSWPR